MHLTQIKDEIPGKSHAYPHHWQGEEQTMTEGETMYLAMAISAFVVFALVLAYVSQRQK